MWLLIILGILVVALLGSYIASIRSERDRWHRILVPPLILLNLLIYAVLDEGKRRDVEFLRAEIDDLKFGYCSNEDASSANYVEPRKNPQESEE